MEEEKKLTEEVLLNLGFEKNIVSAEESGNEIGYFYFTLELKNRECLISDANDEAEKNGYFTVSLFNSELGVCTTDKEVKTLYKALMCRELRK